jgi:SAM-dependent methyltransferase
VLEGAPGPNLADIGGGTGNYAAALLEEGWEPLVIDRSRAMLALAEAKGLRTLEADAGSLPLEDASFDAVTMISMIHHLDDSVKALREARRVLRDGGRLAVVAFTREDVADLWLIEYFPVSSAWMAQTHPPLGDLLEHLPGAVRTELRFTDLEDASLAALATNPELILDPAWRRQTSYFERLARDHPDELAEGLEHLRSDVGAGRAPDRPGRASLIAWRKE